MMPVKLIAMVDLARRPEGPNIVEERSLGYRYTADSVLYVSPGRAPNQAQTWGTSDGEAQASPRMAMTQSE
jgi:hypothetical protein